MLNRYRGVIVVALTALLGLLVLSAGAWCLYDRHTWAAAKLAELEPRYARLKGLVLSEKALKAAVSGAGKSMETTTYPASLDVDRASSELQQRIKKMFEGAGVTVVTSRILEPKPGKDFDVLSVSFSVNAGLASLQTALALTRQEAPLLKIEEFALQPVRRQLQYDPELVICTMTISALRKRS